MQSRLNRSTVNDDIINAKNTFTFGKNDTDFDGLRNKSKINVVANKALETTGKNEVCEPGYIVFLIYRTE